jgi:hypothetical protein
MAQAETRTRERGCHIVMVRGGKEVSGLRALGLVVRSLYGLRRGFDANGQ